MQLPRPTEVDSPNSLMDENHSPSGTLKIGRVVWSKNPQEQVPEQRISVYVEGIGLVLMASRLLRRTSVTL